MNSQEGWWRGDRGRTRVGGEEFDGQSYMSCNRAPRRETTATLERDKIYNLYIIYMVDIYYT